MDVTLPMALLATGYYTPKLCVRHGEPAAALWPLRSGTIRDWPFCRRCVKTRRSLRALAVACAVVPFVAMAVGIALSVSGNVVENVGSGAVMVGLLASWVLVTRTSPSRLARAMVVDSQMWLVVQGAHPAFSAHMADLLRAADREQPAVPRQEPVFPAAEGEINMGF